jgi:2,3-dihydroxybenzoate-AMP ligase
MSPLLDGCTPWPEEFVDRYWSVGHWRGVTLDNLLADRARLHATRPALVHGGARLTYGQLNRRVERTAAGFRLRGLRPGQRVVLRLPNVPEFYVTLFALMRVGAVPVVCPESLDAAGLTHVVRVTEAAGHVGPAGRRAEVAAVAAEGPFLRRAFGYDPPGTASPYGGMAIDTSGCHHFPLASVEAAPGPAPVRGAGEVAFLLLSHRPGGAPRLVPRTHDAYGYQVRASWAAAGLGEDDVLLAALAPDALLAAGCPGAVGTLLAGGTVVLADGPEPEAWLPLLAAEGVTCVTLTAADLEGLGEAEAGALRLVQVTGGPAPELPCPVQEFAALPEGVLLLDGRPLTGDDELRVVGPDGAEAPEGELLARGPAVPRGHYREPGSEAFTADGRFRTGLRVRRTPDGALVVTGSVTDMATGPCGQRPA